jgi:2-hydroxy-3-oxopropionate reductase
VEDFMPEKIGFVGLGIMGRPMAINLVKAGHDVHGYDLFPAGVEALVAAGGKAASSPADAGKKGDIIITMVQDGPQAEAAILGENGVLAGAAAGKLIVDMSSIAPSVSQRIGKGCAAKGVGFLDGPVSGGEPGAINAALAIMVGGDAKDFERAKPVFDKLGKSAVLCGKVGAGQVVKLANQIIVGANIHALAEAMVLAAKSGVNPETVFEAIKGGLAGSNVMNTKGPMMFNRNFQPGFRIELHYKDINNAMQAARELNVPLQVTANLQQVLGALMIAGDGKLDHSGILRYVERLAGAEVKKH